MHFAHISFEKLQSHFNWNPNVITVALTDGKTILMDNDLRPNLNHKGIVCENKEGNWSVKCVRRGDLNANTELAGLICFSLGFSGFNFFNVSRVDEKGEILRRDPPGPPRNAYYQEYLTNTRQAGSFGRSIYKRSIDTIDSHHHIRSHEVIVAAPPKTCHALYLECVPHSHVPIDEPTTEHTTTIPEPSVPSNQDHRQTTTVPSTNVHASTDPEHEPTTGSSIVPDDEHGNATEPRVIEDNFKAPWLASIYIDGDLMCIGVLLDRQWILVDNNCVESAEYEIFII